MVSQLQSKKKFRNLNSTGKELLYSFSGFGPNFLMVLMGAYFQNAVNPTALGPEVIATQSIGNICLVMPLLFSILWFIAKCFDGLIDIPFASITDSLRTKYGNRRIPIAICFAPMVVGYALCWYPICGITPNSVGNTIWIFAWALLFFASYTMSLIAFYGSLSTVCADEKQKTRVCSFKSFFDTVSYALVYALIPVILKSANLRIDRFVFYCLPLMLTMIIPLFVIKEGEKWEAKAIAQGYDITPLSQEKPVKFVESIKLTFKNKPFVRWLAVNGCSFFGLQLFLVSMNALESGAMGLTPAQITIANTCAFAPVPIMLYLFNKLKANNGVRFAFLTALLTFSISISGFFFGSKLVFPGDNNASLRFAIACISGIVGSFGIGSFFMMGYLIPSQISSVEELLTKKNHASMYFASQAVTTSILGAISSSLIWENIKSLFFSTAAGGVVKALPTSDLSAYQVAANTFGVDVSKVFNLGCLLVPIIVVLVCVAGFIICFWMPKRYTHECIGCQIIGKEKYAKIQKKLPKTFVYPFESESVAIFNILWFLSGTLFGYIWYYSLINATNTFAKSKISKWWILLAVVFPPWGAYICYRLNKRVQEQCDSLSIKVKKLNWLMIVPCILLLNLISCSIIQYKLNKIAKLQNPKLRKVAING